MNSIIGIVATLASLIVIFFGLPAQILKNYRRKSTEGLSNNLIYSACSCYATWCLYGWTKPDYFLIIAQTPGIILSLILLYQLFLYKK